MEILSKVHGHNLVRFAKDKPEILVLSADLTDSTEIDLFKNAYPDRFLSMGIAEQNMLSFASGLAREGFCPFVHTFAVFIYRRAYDQIAMSVAYSNVNVKLFGFLPGITTPGGATHQAIEDIAVMRALPNMTILECGDATEVESVLDVAYNIAGPVYIRMIRGEIPRIFASSDKMVLNQARSLSQGSDFALFTSGICTEEALLAGKALTERGVGFCHLHISTHKPFDDPAILAAITRARYGVITMENHVTAGGLGTSVAEIIAREGIAKKLYKIGIEDVFSPGASKEYLMRLHGIDARGLVEKVESILDEKFTIGDEELHRQPVQKFMVTSKPEAL